MTRHEAVVVGGGIAGAATAYHLTRAGVDALLVDRTDEGRATDAGAGIVSPATSSRTGSTAWFDYGVPAADYYDDLAAALEAAGYDDHGYADASLLAVAVDHAEVEAFDGALTRVRDRQARLGVPAEGAVEELSAAEAREAFPPLADVERAMRYTGAGRVDGASFTAALRGAARDDGLTVREATADGVELRNGAVEAVSVDGERVPTDAVVVAGGAWSRAFGDDLGVDIPVFPMRGQIAHVDVDSDGDVGADADTDPDAETATGTWPIVKAYRGHYLVPWSGGRVAAGATREADSGFAPHPTAGGVHEVLDEALRVAPGLAGAELREVRVGLRPATDDGLPVLGAVPGVEGAYINTGHGPTGLTLGPYSGRQVARLVRGREPEVDLDAFSVDRF